MHRTFAVVLQPFVRHDRLLQRRASTLGIHLLPLFAIGGRDRYLFDGTLIEATYVDAKAFRMRARYVKRLDATNRTEKMLRGAGVELVGRQKLGTREQLES